MTTLTKLDTYDYVTLPGVIQVSLTGTNDPILVDILSELDKSNGRIYVDGHYYLFLGYGIHSVDGQIVLDLEVVETA